MPTWLQIIVGIVGLIGTILGILGITNYHGERMKHKAQKKNEQEDEIAKQLELTKRNEYIVETMKALDEKFIEPLNDNLQHFAEKLDSIDEKLESSIHGTTTLLRNDMEKLLDRYKKNKCISSEERANWNELYKTYVELGGNHFKEYVNQWKSEIDNLPLPTDKPTAKKINKSRSHD